MKSGNGVLRRLRKDFPNLTKVIDARKSVRVEVSKKDSDSSRKKDPKNCALATACKRSGLADGAVIGIAFSYLIRKNKAIRFKTSSAVAREIVSFDRHHDFASGKDYLLSKVSRRQRLTARPKRNDGAHSKPKAHVYSHRTTRIRVIK